MEMLLKVIKKQRILLKKIGGISESFLSELIKRMGIIITAGIHGDSSQLHQLHMFLTLTESQLANDALAKSRR